MFSSITNTHRPNKARCEQAATPTPSVNNIESVAVDEENCVQLGYHYKGTEEQIKGEREKSAWYEGLSKLFGGGEGDDENASRKSMDSRNSRKDDKSVISALSNSSNKSARSNKSFVSAVAIEPTSEAVHEDVENIPLNDCDAMLVDGGQGDDDNASRKSMDSRNSRKDDKSVTSAQSYASNKSARSNKSFVSAVATESTLEAVHEDAEDPLRVEVRRHYMQKSQDVAAGLSRKKSKFVVGLMVLLVVVVGFAVGFETAEKRANVEVAAAAYLENHDETHGQLDHSYYYYSEIHDTGEDSGTSEEVNATISSEPI